MAPFKVIVIGGGLSGLLLANGLQNSGIDFTLYERDARDSKREGYQIRLGGPALVGFRACLQEEDLNAIVSKFGRANGKKAAAPILFDSQFRTLLDLTSFKGYEKSAPISRVVLRDALVRPLEDGGAKLMFDKKFDRLEVITDKAGEDRVRVWFGDGASEEADLVIGADGNHSRVNTAVGMDNIAGLTTHWATISKGSLSAEDAKLLPDKIFKGPALMFDSGLSLYFSAYLPDDQTLDSYTSTQPAFDESLATCMFGLFIPRERCPPNFPSLPAAEKVDFLKSCMRPLAPEYTKLVNTISSSDPYVYTPRASIRVSPTWRSTAHSTSPSDPSKGHPRIWLIGDAAHAMLPYRGMGGNQSMADCASVLSHLKTIAAASQAAEHPLHSSEMTALIARECQAYEREMLPRAFSWVEKSGGRNIMPFDSAGLGTRTVFAVLVRPVFAVYVALYELWGAIFGRAQTLDDAPEFQ